MQKIILYYIFTPVIDPQAVRLWQIASCKSLNLRGRILLSTHGINGTLGGEVSDLNKYCQELKNYAGFKDIIFKWGNGGYDDFPKLSVRVRDEIVSFGASAELQVDSRGVVGGGTHLSPEAVHELVAERGDEVVFFDGRNAYEAQVGKFKNAVVSDAKTSKDFLQELSTTKYDNLKHRPVITYCTGGIRCEILSSLMINRGFTDVYQIDGGIVNYGRKYADEGLWEGSLYMFNGQMGVKFSDKAKDIGVCVHCAGKTSRNTNCSIKTCDELVVICGNCSSITVCKTCQSLKI